MQRRQLLVFAAVAAVATAAPQARGRALRVVASFSILADMAREVGGAAVDVTSLVPADTDAHVYQPRPADARLLAGADLVLVNGLGFDGWIERLVAASGYRGPLVVASRGITPRAVAGGVDPHAWQSPVEALRYVANIAAALASAAPADAAGFEARAADYRLRIGAIDRWARRRFEAIGPERRRVITAHAAFGYLGDAYAIRFFSPQGWNTDTEVSAADIARLVTQARELHVRALFVENMSDRRLLDTIAREARAAVGGTLYSDALSAPGTATDSYLKLLAHNVETIAAALEAGTAAGARR